MYILRILLLSLFVCFWSFGLAQNKELAEKDIEMLASPAFKGRGYTRNGDTKAARYIRKRLKKLDVQAFEDDWFQEFEFPINTFPGKMEVRLENQNLTPGVDYLVAPYSNSYQGKVKLHVLTKKILQNMALFTDFAQQDHSDAFIVVDTFTIMLDDAKLTQRNLYNQDPFKARGYIVLNSKLIHGLSTQAESYTTLHFRPGIRITESCNLQIKVKNEMVEKSESQNVIGYIPGKTDTAIVITAHYDHLGEMGRKTYFPGAHDNASGVAMVLNLAEELSKNKNKLHYTYVFMFFSGEEAGLIGSHFYTENPVFPLSKIKFLLNLDLIGSGDDGITVVNGTILSEAFELMQSINNQKELIKQVKPRAAAANSDHYFFYENDVPSFFVYTMGNYKEYHNINDKAEALEMPVFEQLFELFYTFVLKI